MNCNPSYFTAATVSCTWIHHRQTSFRDHSSSQFHSVIFKVCGKIFFCPYEMRSRTSELLNVKSLCSSSRLKATVLSSQGWSQLPPGVTACYCRTHHRRLQLSSCLTEGKGERSHTLNLCGRTPERDQTYL